MTKTLTIGMATYDDFDGVFFSVQAIRMYHKEILDDIEIVIVDNNPGGNTVIQSQISQTRLRIILLFVILWPVNGKAQLSEI